MKLLNPELKRKLIAMHVDVYLVTKKEDVEYGDIFTISPITAKGMYVSCPQCKEKIVLEAIKLCYT